MTKSINATPNAIDSPVSDEASARCCMFRQAIFQKDMRSGGRGQEARRRATRCLRHRFRYGMVYFFQGLYTLKLVENFRRMGDQKHRDLFSLARRSQKVDHLLLMGRVNIGRRLIGQQQGGLVG